MYIKIAIGGKDKTKIEKRDVLRDEDAIMELAKLFNPGSQKYQKKETVNIDNIRTKIKRYWLLGYQAKNMEKGQTVRSLERQLTGKNI